MIFDQLTITFFLVEEWSGGVDCYGGQEDASCLLDQQLFRKRHLSVTNPTFGNISNLQLN